jgi:hypothetical protein
VLSFSLFGNSKQSEVKASSAQLTLEAASRAQNEVGLFLNAPERPQKTSPKEM